MLTAALVAVGTLLYGTLVGYLTHWVMHQPWAGRVNRAHMTHHVRLYPPKALLSDVYKSAGKDDGLLIFVPAITAAMGLWAGAVWLLGAAWWNLVVIAVVGVSVGWLHNYVHEGFHIRGFWMERFGWFRRVRALHWLHHWNMRKNLGICWFGWDRVFRTFRANPRPLPGRSA